MPRSIEETTVGSGVHAIAVKSGRVEITIVAPHSPSAYVLVRDRGDVLGHFTIGDLERLVARHREELTRARDFRASSRIERVNRSKKESADEPSGTEGAEDHRGDDAASGS